jgi:hypothetical protein
MTIDFHITFVITLVLSCAIVQGVESNERQAEILRLILQLDDDAYQVREQATHRLTEIGEPAIEELTKALRHDSPEVRHRVRKIIDTVRRPLLYTISFDGRLFQLSVGRRGFEKHLVTRLGKPFHDDKVMVEGLDTSPLDGRLYAAVTFLREGGRDSKLYRIDLAEKAVQLVGKLAATEIDGLAFDEHGVLFGTISSAQAARKSSLGQLLRIDPATAEVKTVNDRLNYGDMDALAISANGTVIASSSKTVIRTAFAGDFGVVTKLSRHRVTRFIRRVGDLEGMAFDGKSTIYGICHRQTTGHLIRFDIEKNTCVYLGDLGFPALNLANHCASHDIEPQSP